MSNTYTVTVDGHEVTIAVPDDFQSPQEVYDEQLRQLLNHDGGLDDIFTACGRVGRNSAPTLLLDLLHAGILTEDHATALVGDVWSTAEFPAQYLDADGWMDLFGMAGYTVGVDDGRGRRAELPAAPLTLYRGAPHERRMGWSWTDDLAVAARFSDGTHYRRQRGDVWQATVPTHLLLARIDSRDESEFVVNPATLHPGSVVRYQGVLPSGPCTAKCCVK